MTQSSSRNDRFILPALGRVYAPLSGWAETILRVVAGGALVIHGAGKIVSPFAAAGMVESLGFYPGALWSLILSLTEFFGGLLIVFGLFTRPAALAGFILLMVTVWAHWVAWGEGYGGAEKSIIWAAVLFFFALRGANRHSLDARLGREF